MAQSNDLIRLLQIIYKWRKPTIIVTLIVIIGSCIITWFFMPDYYKSTVSFYPSNPVMNDRQVLYSTAMGELKIDYFGSSSDVDRILTLAHTSAVEDHIINTFNLMNHYGFDSTKILSRYHTKKKFESNFAAFETKYGAIEISIWDTDKDLAAAMANYIVETIDKQNKDLIYNDKKNILETFTAQIQKQNKDIATLLDSVEHGHTHNMTPDKLEILEKQLQNSIDNRNENQKILEQYQTSANTNYSTVHITEAAYPAMRKDKPARSIIVIGATLSTLFFMIILAVITENYRRIKDQIKNV